MNLYTVATPRASDYYYYIVMRTISFSSMILHPYYTLLNQILARNVSAFLLTYQLGGNVLKKMNPLVLKHYVDYYANQMNGAAVTILV
jgi:hypothetical protein